MQTTVEAPTTIEAPSGEQLYDTVDLLPGSGRATPPLAPARGRLPVLIVDDSATARRTLARLVERIGLRPLPAADGVEALEAVESSDEPPILALVDSEMPRMNGYELTAALRAREGGCRRLPILLLTSHQGAGARRQAFELGATECLLRPLGEETLLEMIRWLLGYRSWGW